MNTRIKKIKYKNQSVDTSINSNLYLFSKKIINLLMKDGKKIKASKLFFEMLWFLKKRINNDSSTPSTIFSKYILSDCGVLFVLVQALQNVMPSVEVRKVRVRGSTYLVPAILSKKRQESLAIKWIIEAAQKKQKYSKLNFAQSLADEIFEAVKKQGQARQKRDELHRLAEANRAYIRYRWW